MAKPQYRLYIDEVGHHSDYKDPNDIGQRYLSLTGVIIALGYVADVVYPKVEALKSKFFHSHPDSPVILHRKEIINKRGPFSVLSEEQVENDFNNQILNLFSELNYRVITVVLDKKQHKEQYLVWQYHPYHYCLAVMVERYLYFLSANNCVGDVMCESRGGREDKQLKQSFHRLWNNGSDYIPKEKFQAYLSSSQLKVKPKQNNISGLQIADLLAHPSFKRILLQKGHISTAGSNFGDRIVKILEEDKYYRGQNNKLWGFGKKWLP